VKIKKLAIRKFKNFQIFTPVLVVGLLVVVGAVIYNFGARAATASFYFTSDASSYQIGDRFTVNVFEDSGTVCANVAQADFAYPANLLEFNGYSVTNSKFEAVVPTTLVGGNVSTIQYTTRKECGTGGATTSGVSGAQLLGTATFTVRAVGNATLNFQNSSIAISAADNRTNVAPGSSGMAFTLTAPPATPNPTPTPPVPHPVPRPAPAPAPKPVTSVTPTNSDTSIPLENNDSIEVTTPVDVEPLPIQPDGISRIEYYLNDKLVATVKTSPYTYHLDASKYLNGTYTMTTKTFYANGQSKSVSQKVVIKNPFGLTQAKLWVQKYILLVVLGLLLIGAAVAAWLIHRHGAGPTNYYGDSSNEDTSDYTTVSSGTFVKPTQVTTGDDVYKPTGSTGGTTSGS
jgi:hypothetical protein